MRVVVGYLGQVRVNMSISREELLLEEHSAIREAVEALHRKHGARFSNAALDRQTGELSPYLVVTVNGVNAYEIKGLDTVLCDGDEVVFVPPLTGG
ncbi:MAG: hypothetical protein EPO21_16490 [Chloroflexota bacterium]|nr:MAG: hypothetical protein EPO21_16490 [Chloroflexota bacterium]